MVDIGRGMGLDNITLFAHFRLFSANASAAVVYVLLLLLLLLLLLVAVPVWSTRLDRDRE